MVELKGGLCPRCLLVGDEEIGCHDGLSSALRRRDVGVGFRSEMLVEVLLEVLVEVRKELIVDRSRRCSSQCSWRCLWPPHKACFLSLAEE